MSLERVSDLEVGVPDLESTIPTGRGEVGLVVGLGLSLLEWGVSDAADPVAVVVGFSGKLAVSESVPELDTLVSSSGDDLSVVLGQGNSVHFLGVANESSHGLSSLEVPKSQGLVPGRGNDHVVLIGKGQVTDEVVVTGEGFLGNSVVTIDVVTVELPNDQGLVSGTGDQERSVLVLLETVAGCQTGYPVTVTLEDTHIDEVI